MTVLNGKLGVKNYICSYAWYLPTQFFLLDSSACERTGSLKSLTWRCLSTPPYKQRDDKSNSFFKGLAATEICCASSLHGMHPLSCNFGQAEILHRSPSRRVMTTKFCIKGMSCYLVGAKISMEGEHSRLSEGVALLACWRITGIPGSRYANVLPLPGSATAWTSLPSRHAGQLL